MGIRVKKITKGKRQPVRKATKPTYPDAKTMDHIMQSRFKCRQVPVTEVSLMMKDNSVKMFSQPMFMGNGGSNVWYVSGPSEKKSFGDYLQHVAASIQQHLSPEDLKRFAEQQSKMEGAPGAMPDIESFEKAE
ncbi:hypothetical protein ADUPG1_007016 [Aduncisulcus paluster]|uniref:Uncharacterized protein n=1 Tax=Aduncisulcus paluster TaxID=2918883 RepID=A0ABQ5KNV8_9EUKA|nr:hypothetical protein ADUPG1_007016 [Aduncisulcus paluster]|eukprot:gnl/Carplike_NY0171/151_a219_8252.p2 GENE.gnl/Carplike_NY0171/151_a219_8252~~gnl/Carplike_NY0171/151_a219_8252.p2  ORF type:complete len:133 (+),score=43.62 gnl/Carplike_NY0171/151_a219_8252:33-431(+)